MPARFFDNYEVFTGSSSQRLAHSRALPTDQLQPFLVVRQFNPKKPRAHPFCVEHALAFCAVVPWRFFPIYQHDHLGKV
jgi:hypothetical protein